MLGSRLQQRLDILPTFLPFGVVVLRPPAPCWGVSFYARTIWRITKPKTPDCNKFDTECRSE